MKRAHLVVAGIVAALSLRCSLYSDVAINPLFVKPGDVRRPASGVIDLMQIGDYPRAVALRAQIDAKQRQSYKELAALGNAEMACGHLDAARFHLRRAIELRPIQTDAAAIAWDLSQTEFLANQYAAAREWARIAEQQGLRVRPWYLHYLEALENVNVYAVGDVRSTELKMSSNEPKVPRVEVRVNDSHETTAVIDTAAVLSIISRKLADQIGVRSLGDFEGTFYGLLGEPIAVRFGMIDHLQIGKISLRNVPVAIMADNELSFLITDRKPFKIDFLLGANLLKEFRLALDFRRNRARISFLGPLERRPAPDQNLFFVGFRPLVHATINRKGWYLFLLDTGSEITFLNETQLMNTPIRNLQTVHSATLQGLGGSQKRGLKLEGVEIGVDRWAGAFRHIPLYSTEQTNALGILGENFLRKFDVVIDFGTMKMILDPHRLDMSAYFEEPTGEP